MIHSINHFTSTILFSRYAGDTQHKYQVTSDKLFLQMRTFIYI